MVEEAEWKVAYESVTDLFHNGNITQSATAADSVLDGMKRQGYDDARTGDVERAFQWWDFNWEFGESPAKLSLENNFPYGKTTAEQADYLITEQGGLGYANVLENMMDGMSEALRLHWPVTEIDAEGLLVKVSGPEGSFRAKTVIFTGSIGVLKNSVGVDPYLRFKPQLSEAKQAALAHKGMGQFTKVFLTFESNFWGDRWSYVNADGDEGNFPVWINMNHADIFGATAPYIIVGFLVGDQAMAAEELVAAGKQADVKNKAETVLQKMFGLFEKPVSTDIHVSSWDTNPFTRGCWVAYYPNSDYERTIRAPINDQVYFAGEGHVIDWGYVQSALKSGKAVAQKLAREHAKTWKRKTR